MILRKKGILLLIILIILVFIPFYFLTDRVVEGWLESAGSAAVGAKVEIDHLDIGLFSLSVSWDSLQVTHPKRTMKNMISTGPMRIQFSLSGLLRGKWIIEESSLKNIKTFTDRKTDGALPKKIKKTAPKESSEPSLVEKQFTRVKEEFSKAPVLSVPSELKDFDPEKVFRNIRFESPGKLDSLKNYYQSELARWQKEVENPSLKTSLKNLESQIRAIDPKNIKKAEDLKTALDNTRAILDSIQRIRKEYGAKQKELEQFLNEIRQSDDRIASWLQQDYARVKNIVQLPDLSRLEIARYLFGNQIIGYYEDYVHYTELLRRYQQKLSSDQPKKENPPRGKGQNIYFVPEQPLPKFWLKHALLSGETNGQFSLSGELTNATSHPLLINKPMIFQVKGTRKDGASYQLAWIHELKRNQFKDSLQFSLNAIPVVSFPLQNSTPLLPFELTKGKATLDIRGKASNVRREFLVKVRIDKPEFAFSTVTLTGKDQQIRNLSERVFADIGMLTLEFRTWDDGKGLRVQVKSNIDELLQQKIRTIVGEEVAKAEQRVKKEFDKQVAAQGDRFRTWLQEQLSDIEKKNNINLQELKNLENLQQLKKKEIENELKKRSKDIINRFIR